MRSSPKRNTNEMMTMKMKCVLYGFWLLSCFLTGSEVCAGQAETIHWQTYDKGIRVAQNEGKRVFLHFYANWCLYCRKMAKETFQDKSVIEYLNQNYISIRVDSDKDRRTASIYNVRALPSTWFLTKKGEKIGNVPGYLSPKQFLEILKRLDRENQRSKSQGG